MSRPTLWRPRHKIHHLTRNAMGGFPSDELLSQVREHAEVGERVRVRRLGYRAFDIVENGGGWLVLPTIDDGLPIGTFFNVCAAVMAGDRHVEAVRRGEFDAEWDGRPHPRGAA